MEKRIRTLVCVVLLAALPALPSAAQELIELHGVVSDETGAAIIAATVVIEGQDQKYTAQTNDQGQYRIAKLKPGAYTLTVNAEGFAPFTSQLQLGSERAAAANVTLKVTINEEEEVRSDTEKVTTDPDKNLSGITLSSKDLEALPDDPDEMLSVLRQMAGATEDATVYVDGFREGGRLPPKEAIQQIRINANPFAAQFSEPGFARIEIITKPGTNSYHGSFRFDFNSSALDARNAFAAIKPAQQIKSYNGVFNGPIIRNRWDIFFNFERREQDDNQVVNATVLDPTTLQPTSFVQTIQTPRVLTNFAIRTNYLVTKASTIGLWYRHTSSDAVNQGLGGGFDLPERAFTQSARDDTLRFSFVTVASEHAVNEFRMELSRRSAGAQALDDQPAIVVFDAFSSGGNQSSLFSDVINNNLSFTDDLSYTHNKHAFKFGVRADATRLENTNRANFGGTFTFGADFDRDANGNPILDAAGQPLPITPLEHYRRTLLGLPGYSASQFTISRGDPFVGFSQWNLAWYAQDDWRLSPKLTLSYGLRHEFETHLQDKLNFAPRLGVAWAPTSKGTIRAGAGIFYTYLDTGITLDAIRFDGSHQQQLIINSPAFFPSIPATFSDTTIEQQVIRVKSSGLNAPYAFISTVSYERQLPWKLLGSIGYTFQRGVHLLRTRDINAPDPQTGLRPSPDAGPILQFESTGLSTRNELRVTLRTNLNSRVTLFSNYILSSTHSDTDGAYTAPANSYDLADEYGRASFDQRHRFFVGGSVSLPWQMRLSPYLFASSGRPFNITTGRDNNLDTLFTDRPAFASPTDPGAIITPFGVFNPNPGPDDPIIPRNFGEGPGQLTLNLSFSKTFGFGPPPKSQAGNRNRRQNRGGGGRAGGGGFGGGDDSWVDSNHRYNLTFSVNAQNVINHTNLAGINGILTSPLFGLPNQALAPRRVDLALRFNF
ncbi:MAG TPA: TonB-dependent receptor [Blastocatellia bacterium]|nr:TonB-dependent receptor [Blastocatellia bacterium]